MFADTRSTWTLAACCALALSGSAGAQTPGLAYSHHWAPMIHGIDIAFSGPSLFGVPDSTNWANTGDAIRRCYGVDSVQLGKNDAPPGHPASFRKSITSYRIAQGWAQANTIPGIDIGLVSIQIATDSDLGGDACFAPFLASAGNKGGHEVVASATPGLIAGTAGAPFPAVYDLSFQWVGTASAPISYKGVGAPVTKGSEPFAPGSLKKNPLLATMIFEVQGPATGGPNNQQYYLASTTEVTGRGNFSSPMPSPATHATGGVTNGNSSWGSSITGVDATTSGLVSHSRILSTDPQSGAMAFSAPSNGMVQKTGRVEMAGFLGFKSPFLWASNDQNEGAGGADWRVSTAPVSIVNLRVQDHLAGAMTTTSIYGGVGGPSSVYTPGITLNQPVFLWSATPAVKMSQMPLSWDDLGGAVPGSPGGSTFGLLPTLREGPEPVPVNFDAITTSFLGFASLSMGSSFSSTEDMFLDGPPPGYTASNSFLEGHFNSISSGVAGLASGSIPAAGGVSPNLAGTRLGVVAIGVQANSITGFAGVTDISSPLTIVLQ